jgi:hypothetical protein
MTLRERERWPTVLECFILEDRTDAVPTFLENVRFQEAEGLSYIAAEGLNLEIKLIQFIPQQAYKCGANYGTNEQIQHNDTSTVIQHNGTSIQIQHNDTSTEV